MEDILDILKLLIPASLVLYAMYLTIKSFLQRDFERSLLQIKSKNAEVAFPIRLQAYERMTLFLDRITPNNLVLRLSNPNYKAKEFHQILVNDVREEFNHNIAQQLYMSEDVWAEIVKAKDEVISLINLALSQLPDQSGSLELGKAIFKLAVEQNRIQTLIATRKLKSELMSLYA